MKRYFTSNSKKKKKKNLKLYNQTLLWKNVRVWHHEGWNKISQGKLGFRLLFLFWLTNQKYGDGDENNINTWHQIQEPHFIQNQKPTLQAWFNTTELRFFPIYKMASWSPKRRIAELSFYLASYLATLISIAILTLPEKHPDTYQHTLDPGIVNLVQVPLEATI